MIFLLDQVVYFIEKIKMKYFKVFNQIMFLLRIINKAILVKRNLNNNKKKVILLHLKLPYYLSCWKFYKFAIAQFKDNISKSYNRKFLIKLRTNLVKLYFGKIALLKENKKKITLENKNFLYGFDKNRVLVQIKEFLNYYIRENIQTTNTSFDIKYIIKNYSNSPLLFVSINVYKTGSNLDLRKLKLNKNLSLKLKKNIYYYSSEFSTNHNISTINYNNCKLGYLLEVDISIALSIMCIVQDLIEKIIVFNDYKEEFCYEISGYKSKYLVLTFIQYYSSTNKNLFKSKMINLNNPNFATILFNSFSSLNKLYSLNQKSVYLFHLPLFCKEKYNVDNFSLNKLEIKSFINFIRAIRNYSKLNISSDIILYHTNSTLISDNEDIIFLLIKKFNITILDTKISFGKPGLINKNFFKLNKNINLCRRFYSHLHNIKSIRYY